jgi:hypothetical protein
MVIKASASAEIRPLIESLQSDDDVRREAAVARLAIIGARAVGRLISTYSGTTDRAARVAVLRALEAIGDPRSAALARQAIGEEGDVAIAGVGVLRGLLDTPHEATATEALDALVTLALDPRADRRIRLAAFEGLQDMPQDVREQVAEALQEDPDVVLRKHVRSADREAAQADAVWNDAIEGRLPDDPGTLAGALGTRAAAAPLSALQKLIDVVRGREENAGAKRDAWLAVRGSLHQALALRGSRVALYDLRETLSRADRRLPASFLAALHVLGDRACLAPLADAWGRAEASDAWWRHQLSSAFHAIARREKITRRHSVMKRINARWPHI